MITYQYSGINRFGKRVRGEMQARNVGDFEKRIKDTQITILTYKEKPQPFYAFLVKKNINKKDVIVITTQIRQLLNAGVPFMEVLDDLQESYENKFVRAMLATIYEDMSGGSTFSEALKVYEKEFGAVYISLVTVGETTGQLDVILKRLEDMMKWELALASKAKKVMIYPSIVAFVVIGVVFLMMLFVVPQLVSFMESIEGELGFATVALIATSAFIQNNIMLIIIFPFVLVFVVKYWLAKSEKFRLKFDTFILKINIIGPVLYNIKIARLASSISIMYSSGTGFTDSLRMSTTVLGNKFLEKNVIHSIGLIEEGGKIFESFKEADVFPAMAIRMIKVGEISGNMDEALANISEYYDLEAKDQIDKIEPAIEPILTIVMAVVIGWVMIAVLGPVYDSLGDI